jgi:hypothetical protein
MKESKKNKIQDLVSQIEEVDKMILFNAANPSKLMSDQYEYRKERFLSELIEELMSLKNLSKYSFQLIYMAIHKYYPEMTNATPKKGKGQIKLDKQSKELKALETLLVA